MDFRSIRYIIGQGLPKFGSNWLSSFGDVCLNIPFFHNHKKILVTVTQSVTNVPQTNNTNTSGMNEE
jgi:hypothetical protein